MSCSCKVLKPVLGTWEKPTEPSRRRHCHPRCGSGEGTRVGPRKETALCWASGALGLLGTLPSGSGVSPSRREGVWPGVVSAPLPLSDTHESDILCWAHSCSSGLFRGKSKACLLSHLNCIESCFERDFTFKIYYLLLLPLN